nr:MAG TPA: hypothetical protein [Caudoviricetes sp.]
MKKIIKIMIFKCPTASRTQSDSVGQIERFRVVKELCVSETRLCSPSKEVFLSLSTADRQCFSR